MINAVKEDPAGCCEALCRPERRGPLVTPTPKLTPKEWATWCRQRARRRADLGALGELRGREPEQESVAREVIEGIFRDRLQSDE